MASLTSLPVDLVLPALSRALEDGANAVLVAPPGAGKTTRAPLALLEAPWRGDGSIVVLEPRRLAARAAARRMAQSLGERVGERVGVRTRYETEVGPATRLEVVTEGVFTRRLLGDPELAGVACVMFDEIHERSLEGDFGLALALDVQASVRPDLKLVAMSATLDASRVAGILNAPVIESQGRMFPVETRYRTSDWRADPAERVASAVLAALAKEPGSILAFLPGQGEIRRCAERLAERVRDADVILAPLYGALDAREQDQAIAPAPSGRRKVVLATAIAETSLTIEGVRVVIDCGLARRAAHDPALGARRLETVRVSRAAADQRRGRAGRTEPGVCYRLWDEAETRGLPPFDLPEILRADLSALALDLAEWGAEAHALRWLDPPPPGALAAGRASLAGLGALDAGGRITPRGRKLAALPLEPRLAALVVAGAEAGEARLAAEAAAVLSEHGLGGRMSDLATRIAGARADRSPRAAAARALAMRWAKRAGGAAGSGALDGLAGLLARAWPDAAGLARPGQRGVFALANGSGARLDETDPLAGAEALIVAETTGSAANARITAAVALSKLALESALIDRIESRDSAILDPASGRVRARRARTLGALILSETPLPSPSPAIVAAALLDHVRACGLEALRWSERAMSLRARVGFLRTLDPDLWPDLSDAALAKAIDDWLAPYLAGASSLADIPLDAALSAWLSATSGGGLQRLDALSPTHLQTPAGTPAPIDYSTGAPRIEARPQMFFGLDRHPCVADGRIPITLALVSPAGRPIAITTDLPGFWRGGWSDAAKDMRGRYPKHPWPERPWEAEPTTRAKKRGS